MISVVRTLMTQKIAVGRAEEKLSGPQVDAQVDATPNLTPEWKRDKRAEREEDDAWRLRGAGKRRGREGKETERGGSRQRTSVRGKGKEAECEGEGSV